MNQEIRWKAVVERQVIEPYWTTRAGENEDVTFMPTLFDGHCLYCRKCETDSELDGIVMPEITVDRSRWLEVLAIGPNVGMPASKRHMKKFGHSRRDGRGIFTQMWVNRDRCSGEDPMPGDLIHVNTDNQHGTHPGIIKSTLANDEYFIEETTPDRIVRGDENAWRDDNDSD